MQNYVKFDSGYLHQIRQQTTRKHLSYGRLILGFGSLRAMHTRDGRVPLQHLSGSMGYPDAARLS